MKPPACFAFIALLVSLCPAQSPSPTLHEVAIQRDLDYLEPGRKHKLDLYSPANPAPDQRFPGIVIIHGGGWTKGSKSARRELEIGTTLASHGYVCASINYLLGSDQSHPWPTNLHDCKNAVRFLRKHADTHHVDPDHVGVIGGSAGGHLASMVALSNPEAGLEPNQPYPGLSSRVQACIDLYGIADLFTWQETDKLGNPTGVFRDGPPERLLGRTRLEAPDLWRLASPIHHISPDDPPVLILHGTADTTVDRDQSINFARLLDQAGVRNELHLIDGVGHTFAFKTDVRGKPLPTDLTPIVLDFLNRNLKPRHPEDTP